VSEFPLTRERLSPETIEHLISLERGFAKKQPLVIDESGGPDGKPDFDVILAGGGLSLVYASYLARAGLKVAVFDRRKIGCGHREWNISRAELAPLADSGLFAQPDQLPDQLIEKEYREGIVRWHGGATHAVKGVLDCVVSAERLLSSLRGQAEAAGATLLDYCALASYKVGSGGILVRLHQENGAPVTLSGRVLLDGMGAASPHAAFDLCCPTVGGVLRGLAAGDAPDEVDGDLGEILISTEGVEEGRQHIWEGFPGLEDRFTTYLFYYVEPHRLPEHPLLELYERFFATRPRYKRGEGRMEKPTYGFIPAYTRLHPMPAAPRDRVLLVGDAAGRHSPLTFCGFGSMIRSFLPVARALMERLERDRLDRRSLASVWSEPPGLQVMGALTLMMVPGRGEARDPADINRLLDAAFTTLSEMGNDVYAAFVRDQIGFRDFMRFMQKTAKKRPTIYDEVFSVMSKGELAKWSWRLARLGFTQWGSR
jgi:lycopene cyclase CruA